jgi:hypothetical protein
MNKTKSFVTPFLILCTMDFGHPKIKEIYNVWAAVKYALAVTKNLGLGCNSGLCSAGHFLIMHPSTGVVHQIKPMLAKSNSPL